MSLPVLIADSSTTRNFVNVVAVHSSFRVNRSGYVFKKYPGSVPRALPKCDTATLLWFIVTWAGWVRIAVDKQD